MLDMRDDVRVNLVLSQFGRRLCNVTHFGRIRQENRRTAATLRQCPEADGHPGIPIISRNIINLCIMLYINMVNYTNRQTQAPGGVSNLCAVISSHEDKPGYITECPHPPLG